MKNRKISLALLCAAISVFTLVAFHLPFFRYAAAHVESGFNGVAIISCLALLMLVINYFAAYLLIWLTRTAGKVLTGLSFIGDAVMLYFVKTYDVLVDDTMMGNVFNTRYSEASGYWSADALLLLLLLGVLPCILVILVKVDYGRLRRFFANIGIALGVGLVVGFANITNWPWVDREAPIIGSLLMPWSYTVNAVRYQRQQRERNREEILLPDAQLSPDGSKDVVVLVIGESARRDHFSIYGYGRETTPELESIEGVRCYPARAAATYTTAGVKAILDFEDTGKLYEILPNYLHRNGVDVVWRTSNWGEPPLHIDKHQDEYELSEASGLPVGWDEVLLHNLHAQILESGNDRVLIVLHTSTSHGPSYNKKYPPEFQRYSPVCESVEMSKCPREELMNAYDNSILYTDHLLGSVIGILSSLEGWNSCMMYVSDHGESLGEGNLYMHGVPASVAPAEQLEIPFIVWTSPGAPAPTAEGELTQYHVFHSVLHFLEVESPVYKSEFDIFR